MNKLLRTFIHFGKRLATNPLAISSVASSLAGAGSLLIAANRMDAEQFTTFAMLNLVSVTSWGFARVAVFQPALLHLRTDKTFTVPFRYALALCGLLVLPIAVIYYVVGSTDIGYVVALAIANCVPFLQDWLRFRSMGEGRRWRIAIADVTRLLALAAFLPIGWLFEDATRFQTFICLTFFIPIIIHMVRLKRARYSQKYSAYAGDSRAQMADFGLSQLNATIPLLVLGSLGTSAMIGAVRLAQTIFGPLNLVFSASATNLLANGATNKEFQSDIYLIAQTKKLAWRLALVSAIVVVGGFVVAAIIPSGLISVGRDEFGLAILGVGSLAITSGWSAIHTLTLRMLGHNRMIVRLRALLIAGTWSAYAIGAVIGGIGTSVVAGYFTAAALYPILFGGTAYSVYKREMPGSIDREQ